MKNKTLLLLLTSLCLPLALLACDGGGSKEPGQSETPCPAGTLGCPCHDGGTCDTLAGAPLSCQDSVCVQPSAQNNGENNGQNNGDNNGQNNANNGENNANNGDNNGQNNGENNGNNGENNGNNGMLERGVIQIADGDARSCEVVVRDPQGVLEAVSFSDAVRGRTLREGDRVALSFLSRGGEPFAAADIRLVPRGESTLESLELVMARCFDQQGAPLEEASASLLP